MTTAVLLTFVAVWIACMIRYPARVSSAAPSAHPSEGYLFGDASSPTRTERESMLEAAMA